ncbi:MAG: adenylosuccinate synthase [Planctomycetota bacterium]
MVEKKKPSDARKAEADGFADITQNGVALRIPLGEKVPLVAYMAFKDGDEMLGTQLLLGEEQWAAFMATNPTVGDFAEIGQKLTDALGN